MKDVLKQLVTIWREMKFFQKFASGLILLFVFATLSYLVFKSSSSNFVPLCSGRGLSTKEIQEIRNYLEHFAIPYEEDKEKGILVSSEYVEQIRMELAAASIPQQDQRKGFELFDTNTWIKGEKELQVLEMRALKGQLEKDLAGFEQIKSASVILDMPPQRTFNSSQYKTKASVILTLMPGARLSISQLRAITNHLAGAVRGLEPNMIAISDTKGNLYKALDEEPFSSAQLMFEEHVEEKISHLLSRLVGEERFSISVQATVDKQTEEVLTLSIVVLIDQAVLAEIENPHFKEEIEGQLAVIAKGYVAKSTEIVNFIAFEKKRKIWMETQEKGNYTGLFFTLLFVVLALLSLFGLFRKFKKKAEPNEEDIFQLMTRVDLEKLASSIQNEDPATIAMMVSYLEPKRAEQMISALSDDLQEEVLFYLSELDEVQ